MASLHHGFSSQSRQMMPQETSNLAEGSHLKVVTCPFKIGDEAAYRRLGCASGISAHAVSDSECSSYRSSERSWTRLPPPPLHCGPPLLFFLLYNVYDESRKAMQGVRSRI